MGIQDKDYTRLTDSQRARDAAIIERIQENMIAPLAVELESAIPGYGEMSSTERFAKLMKLNETNAPNGAFLMLDFGYGDNIEPLNSAVYSGQNDLYLYSQRDGYKIYHPLFRESFGGVPGGIETNIEYLLEPPEGHDNGFRDTYEQLPLPFKVAVIAQYIRQNVVTTLTNACLFAAGCIDSLETSRYVIHAMEGTSFQRFGWAVTLRDTLPENDMAISLAQLIRRVATTETQKFPGWPVGDGETIMPLYASDKKQRRTRHQSTELLVDFIERYLPGKGLRVTRAGSGEKISWKKAYSLFDELHPDLYRSHTSFMNAYYNARKAREGR